MARILKIGGVGLPNVDAYVPRLALLVQGLAALGQGARGSHAGRQAAYIETVRRAIESRGRLYDYVEANGGLRKGAKSDVDAASYEEIKTFVMHFDDAANVLNALLKDKAVAEFITVKHLGGTVTNKLNAYKGGCGDSIDAVLIGVVGNDSKGAFLRSQLKGQENGSAGGITLLDNGLCCDATPLNYIITEDREGNALGDRHILKGTSNAPAVLRKNEAYILEQVCRLDRLLLEGGEISRSRFGPDLFGKILDAVIGATIDLAFAPCTSHALRTEDPRNEALLTKACYYRHNDMPTVFNLEELLGNYLPEHVKAGMPRGYTPQGMKSDPYVSIAIAKLKLELSQRERNMPRTNSQPIAIVSDGGNGLCIMTARPEQTLLIPAPAGVKLVDTTGAGDNLTGGAFIKATQLASEHRRSPRGRRQELTDGQLVEIARFAQQVARLAIEQQGACVGHDKILKLLGVRKSPPTSKRNMPVHQDGPAQG